jgi:hypothetical protein
MYSVYCGHPSLQYCGSEIKTNEKPTIQVIQFDISMYWHEWSTFIRSIGNYDPEEL